MAGSVLANEAPFQIDRHPVDGGPIYTETRFDRTIAEPFNAASALPFLVLAAYWRGRLRKHRHGQRLLRSIVPLLMLGGVGGTLYHALRVWRGFLLMDFLPILILTLMTSATFARHLLGSWTRVALLSLVLIAGFGSLLLVTQPSHANANFVYAMLGLLVAIPMAWVTLRSASQHWRWLPLCIACFLLALGCRAADAHAANVLSIGTHWLWHLLGAAATASALELVYRVNADLPQLTER